ncbi:MULTISPECIES: glycosyltransferase family 8 protein [unclassified Cyanobium]|uniref:glycosyltransferase family 8 protein n=1 Tax=unclassified Cyanobium TaxID=2627006 RepID=UPI0020CF6960|nr:MULTISPECIES: glycosyltransferase family 8 protein [unclassified Cyanobium]MCP9833655.1 glycosyltransferase family 8 protein [Cyanobium sp. La Preciosa 7G6]MCP9936587.1 glycosyltransferase family 8 protein [Cyanobium sp. Aljojuca 7A6]
MIIACTIDNNYIRHCAVMLKSLQLSNPTESISVYILHGVIDTGERARLAAYLGEFLPSVSFIQLDEEMLSGFPVFGHITLATYFRLLLPAALPHAVEKVLYLDSDLIVVDSIRDLWESALDHNSIGAVEEHNQELDRNRLGLAEGSLVFNAGAMLIDLCRWRRENILATGLEFARCHPERIKHWDQDVLNSLLESRWLPLDWRFNALPHLWMHAEYGDSTTPLGRQAEATRANPAVIHFAGSGVAKPWHHRCTHPWRQRYLEIRQQTPWSNLPLEGAPSASLGDRLGTLRFRIKSAGKRMLGKQKPRNP